MSILKKAVLIIILITNVGSESHANNNKSLIKEVLSAYIGEKYYIDVLEGMRSRSTDFPALVAELTDYDIWQHGMLVELVLEEGGALLVPALEEKLHTEVVCLPEFAKICQPTLADRNSSILSALWNFEHPQ